MKAGRSKKTVALSFSLNYRKSATSLKQPLAYQRRTVPCSVCTLLGGYGGRSFIYRHFKYDLL